MRTKINLRNFFLFAAMGTIITASVSCKKDDPAPAVTPNVVQLAQSDTTLSLLVTLVSKAGLADILSTTNNITVFAPTNAAFRAAGYPDAVIDALTPAQAAAGFTDVLKYHVLLTKVASTDVPASDIVPTLNGKNIYASKNANGVFVNGKKVSKADLAASNGVVHKIDGVLLPPTKTIAELVIATSSLSTLLAGLQYADNGATGLVAALSSPGKFTVFAPDNDAFVTSGITSLSGFTPAQVTGIIKAHVIGTNVFSSDLINNLSAPTLNNTTASPQTLTIKLPALTVGITGSVNPVSDINPAGVDIIATNGVVHLIKRVIQ